MKRNDFQLIGLIGVVLGILFIMGGIFTVSYYEIRGWLIPYAYYPYAEYSAPLFISGIVLLVIGVAFLVRAKQEHMEVPPPTM